MSSAARDWAWAYDKKALSAAERLVLLRLADWASEGDARCYRSQPQLAVECHMNARTVGRALARLAELGLIVIEVAGGGTTCAHYRLPLVGVGRMSTPPRHSDEGHKEEPDQTGSAGARAQNDPPAHQSQPSSQEQRDEAATTPTPSPADATPAADDAAAWEIILPRTNVNAWGKDAKPYYRQACEALTTYGAVDRFRTLFANAPAHMRKSNGQVFFERLPELAGQSAADWTAEQARASEPTAEEVFASDEARRERRRLERHANIAAQQREAVCGG